MANTQTKIKDPDARKDYGIDWSAQWADDPIVSSTWTGPAGIDLEDNGHDDTTTSVWISGGELGTNYTITNHVTTEGGREDDKSLFILVRSR